MRRRNAYCEKVVIHIARPKKEIDLELVEEMAEEFCTQDEIAMDMGFERTLFHRRKDVQAAFARGKNTAKMSLRHLMWNAAKSGDKTMMIFLSKNELGYQDRPEPKETDDHTVEKANKQIIALADLINKPKPERKLEDIENMPAQSTAPDADSNGGAGE